MTEKEITLNNLKLALIGLTEEAKKNPAMVENFNMKSYGCYIMKPKGHPCGTVGCLAGNMARVIPHEDSDYINSESFSYTNFMHRVFPAFYSKDNGEIMGQSDFLFHSEWANFQPTFEQAMQRLSHFIEKAETDGTLGKWAYQKEPFI